MSRTLFAALSYFFVVFSVAFVLGALRAFLFAPLLGVPIAIALEVPIVLVFSWFVCRVIIDRMDVPANSVHRLVMGTAAFALLMVAEAALASVLLGHTLIQHLASYKNPIGLFGLAAQIVFALLPFLQLAWNSPSRRSI